jgi:hypothetical protein
MGLKNHTIMFEEERVAIRVSFRKDRDGEVCAVFLNDDEDEKMTCYAHIGQHSTCVPGWVRETKTAKPDEFLELKAELESIGYDVTPVARMTYPDVSKIRCKKCGKIIRPDAEAYNAVCAEEDRNLSQSFDGKTPVRIGLREWAIKNHECKNKKKK